MAKELLRLAIQKSGRLFDDSISLLSECGIKLNLSRGGTRLKTEAGNFPIEVVFLRDDDIPGYVEDGVVDIGIVGENVVAETGAKVECLEQLGFSKCRLSLAVPRGSNITGISQLENARIATSYPAILKGFLASHGITADVHTISGSVEIAPSIGLADVIFDIISTGSTLMSNGLKELEPVFFSQAVLVASGDLARRPSDDPLTIILAKLRFRIQSVLRAGSRKYIVLNAPNGALDAILDLLPGLKSPTVVPLATSGWSAVHAVLEENEFWEKTQSLRDAGAQGIVVVPIEKMIM